MIDEIKPETSSFLSKLFRYGPILFWFSVISMASTNNFSNENTSHYIKPFLEWLVPDQSEDFIDGIHFSIRKLAHFTEYAILAFFVCIALLSSHKIWLKKYWLIWAIACIVLFALVDEYHQLFEETRMGSIADSLIDSIGGLFTIALFFIIRLFTKHTLEHEPKRTKS